MKSNIHNISKHKNNSCAVFSAIFACKIRDQKYIIYFNWKCCSSLPLDEQSREREGGVHMLWKQDLALVR